MKKHNQRFQIILISFAVLFAYCAVCAFVDLKLLWIGAAFVAIEICGFAVLNRLSRRRRSVVEKGAKLLDNDVSLRLLTGFSDGIAVLDRNGRILWYNDAFCAVVGTEVIKAETDVSDLLVRRLDMISLLECAINGGGQRLEAETRTGQFGVVPYQFGSENEFYLTVWYDLGEITALKNEARIKNPVILYITVDNSAESSGYMQGSYRAVTAKISILLKDWAQSLDSVIHEVDRDRYALIIEEGRLSEVAEKKFDVLDSVRELSADQTDIPVTVSIGCACIDGDLAEKDEASRRALDLALQRGGDQAVLKTRNATEFYGGRTKTVQKRTKIRSRIIAGELIGLMKNADNVIIMGHRYADHDSVGACVGIARLAGEYCRKVNIVVNPDDVNLKPIFKKLRGIEFYEDKFIDGSAAQDLIGTGTLLVICDVNNVKMFEAPSLFFNCASSVIIDHHRKTEEFAVPPKISYIEPSASSASELVSEILEQTLSPGILLKEEAELLFAGMLLDTKHFSRNTGVRTFSAALYLRGEGASPGEAQLLFGTRFDEFTREVRFESNVVVYRGIFAISAWDGAADGEDRIAASKAADRLLGIDGVRASFALCQIDGVVHISARSSGKVNVQLILEKLNGGGYFDAAGAQMKDVSLKEAMNMLKKAIDEYADEA
ncbi:MAG: DHH family phosphoesterase [Clostridia bacterium]|nr:DHH family phosphoesterase [Clostridia bacterium]